MITVIIQRKHRGWEEVARWQMTQVPARNDVITVDGEHFEVRNRRWEGPDLVVLSCEAGDGGVRQVYL